MHRLRTALIVSALLASVLIVVGPASAQTNPPNPLTIVSLGDSYIAGNGAGNYVPGQGPGQPDTSSVRVPGSGANCFHSFSSFPMQYGDQLAVAGFPTTVHQGACSGATTHEVVPQWNVVPAAIRADADVIVISAGGNDAGFTTVVSACLFSLGNCSAALATASAEIVPARDRLEAAIDTIIAEAPYARIVVVGYPYLASPANGSLLCLFAQQQATLTAIQQTHEAELADMVAAVNASLPQDRVELALPSARFLNRGPCAVSGALIHNLTPVEGESFHPNFAGHAEYADLLFDSSFHFDLPVVPTCAGSAVTVDLAWGQAPTSGPDVILGTSGADTINAGGGADLVCAGAGNDVIFGGSGDDTIYGQNGLDVAYGGDDADELIGGNDLDRLYGQTGNDILSGNDGDDRLFGGAGDDTVLGGPGNDRLWGQAGADDVIGGDGDDIMLGGVDMDVMSGEAGDDIAYGQDGNDVMHGGDGDDRLYGNVGDDQINGDDGEDHLYGVGGNDVINGGPARDWIYGGNGADIIHGDGGNDLIYGQAGDDALWGDSGVVDFCHRGAGLSDIADATCETVQ